jgi:hypothetical protein
LHFSRNVLYPLLVGQVGAGRGGFTGTGGIYTPLVASSHFLRISSS